MIVRNSPDRKRGAAPPSDQVVSEAAELGRQVREARKRLRLDQEDVAFAAHVSPRTVFAIEKGKPTVRLDMLARVLAAVGLRLSAERRDVVWQPGTEERR